MRKTTYFCDRCGKEIEGFVWQIGSRKIAADTGEVVVKEWGADLCEECYEKVDEITALAIMNTLPAPERATAKPMPRPKKPNGGHNKKDLDMPKVYALRNAGWSWGKIADEFGVSDQTVINHVRADQKEEADDAET